MLLLLYCYIFTQVVEKLGIKKADNREIGMFEHLNDKVMGFTVAGLYIYSLFDAYFL